MGHVVCNIPKLLLKVKKFLQLDHIFRNCIPLAMLTSNAESWRQLHVVWD